MNLTWQMTNMIIIEVARKEIENERSRLVSMRESAAKIQHHQAYLLGALAVIDWINAGERRASDSLLWILEQDKT